MLPGRVDHLIRKGEQMLATDKGAGLIPIRVVPTSGL
jgi:hypothetical protein